jgi:twinfilin-like protein
MARSNLNVSSDLLAAFTSAQQFSAGIRCIKVNINEECLNVSLITNRQANIQNDFDTIIGTLEITEASILLFNLPDQIEEKSNWLLLSFIPDDCKVREKMLYSSSRDDLKRTLGTDFFKADYAGKS